MLSCIFDAVDVTWPTIAISIAQLHRTATAYRCTVVWRIPLLISTQLILTRYSCAWDDLLSGLTSPHPRFLHLQNKVKQDLKLVRLLKIWMNLPSNNVDLTKRRNFMHFRAGVQIDLKRNKIYNTAPKSAWTFFSITFKHFLPNNPLICHATKGLKRIYFRNCAKVQQGHTWKNAWEKHFFFFHVFWTMRVIFVPEYKCIYPGWKHINVRSSNILRNMYINMESLQLCPDKLA